MLANGRTEVATIGVRLLDDAYQAWFHAEVECETSIKAWCQSTGERRESAYLAYRAALDREEASARDLERLWALAASCRAVLAEQTESVAG